MVTLAKPRIVAAANKSEVDGLLVVSARHFDRCMNSQIKAMGRKATEFREQGFIDQHCNFYTRAEAFVIATENRQIIRETGDCTSELTSENLY